MSSEQSAELPSEATEEVRAGCRDVELAWAREQLHVETDGPEGVWQSLQRCGFLPDGAQIAALEILAGTAPLECSPATADYRRLARREALQCEIEAFAGRFFEHSPPEREVVWRELRERCGEFPGLMLWLEQLETGLSIASPIDAAEGKVISAILVIFQARPGEKPALRRRLLVELGKELKTHVAFAQDLRRQQRSLALLAPDFVEELCSSKPSLEELVNLEHQLANATDLLPPRQFDSSEEAEEDDSWSTLMSALRRFGDSEKWQRRTIALVLVVGILVMLMQSLTRESYHRYWNQLTGLFFSDRVEEAVSVDLARQVECIYRYGLEPAPYTRARDGGIVRQYRVLGLGPDSLISEPVLKSLAIDIDSHLHSEVGTEVKVEVLTPARDGESGAETQAAPEADSND